MDKLTDPTELSNYLKSLINDQTAVQQLQEHLNCFLCLNLVPGGLNELAQHFRSTHGITLNQSLPRTGYVCAQNGCQQSYVHFYDLRKHIKKRHLNDVNQELNEVIDNEYPENINDEDEIPQELEVNVENEDEPIEDQLKMFVIRMIGRLQCNGSLTETMMSNFLTEFDEVLHYLRNFLQKEILSKLRLGQIIDQDLKNDVQKLLQFDSPFDGLHTWSQQKQALTDHCRFIEPSEIPLGMREDKVYDKEIDDYVRKQIMESYQYVPIIEVLKMVLKNRNVRELIAAEEPSADGYLSSFVDGLHFKNHAFFQRYKQAIRIKLYYDELEIVNGLGSKTGVHKLAAFYYEIDNLPPHMNADLGSIHVLLLCSHVNIIHFKFQKVLERFMIDLALLESEEGIVFDCDGEDFVLRGSLMAFCGDGLAVHEIYNMLSPSANNFCRMCMYSRADLHAGILEKGVRRTKELYDEHLELLRSRNFSDASKTITGLKGDSILNKSKYFHICNNKVFDIMHDFLCGICPMVVKLVLHRFIVEDAFFDENYLNTAILFFNYGYVERKNKPSPNFTRPMLNRKDHTLSQKAMQMWCLVRALPLLLSAKIEEDNDYMELILYLLRIMEFVFAPKLTSSLFSYIDELIKEFIETFRSLFPDIDLINKFHHLMHYTECIQWSGPLTIYSCMRFEAKHGSIKLRAQNVYNFKNPPKTLLKVCQCVQSAKWGAGDVPTYRFKIVSGKTIFVSGATSRLQLINIGYSDDDYVFSAKSVFINGIEFRKGLYIVLQKASALYQYPIFGKIEEIIALENEAIYFYASVYKTLLFDTAFHAYQIEFDPDEESHEFIERNDLQFYKTFSDWKKPSSTEMYISLRHIIL